ncbi:MAG: cupin domain-containing protein [Candidatus Pacearchaeota archaeon]
MTFGNTFEEIASRLNNPKKIETKYGYKIEAINESEFSLTQLFFNKGFNGNINVLGGVLFIEKGKLLIDSFETKKPIILESGKSVQIPKNFFCQIIVEEDTLAYLFFSKDNQDLLDLFPKSTFDVLEKYWGKIEKIYSDNIFSAKRIFMISGKQSSLEYHCNKKEAYFLQSGKLKVGLRVGRAENKSIIMNPGDAFVIPRGTMHMRICLENCVIIEISTKDDDKDSHLVEDGQIYVHKEL